MQISQALVALLEPRDNFIFTHAADPEFLLFNWKVSTVAVSVMLIAAIAAVFVARRRREMGAALWVFGALGAASIFLMFPVSAIFWKLLPKLAFVQFPWRWLGPLGFVFAFFVAAAPVGRIARAAVWTSIGLLTVGLAFAIVNDCWWDSEDIPVLAGGIRSGNGYEGTDEYQPVGSDRYSLPGSDVPYGDPPGPETPLVQMMDDATGKMAAARDGSVHVTKWTARRREFTLDAQDDVTIGVRLLKFPAWRATVDGAVVETKALEEDGQLLIAVPEGTHSVSLVFVRTPDRLAGDAISIVFLMMTGGWWVLIRRRAWRPRVDPEAEAKGKVKRR